jgi:hypothetical protein
MRVCSTPRTNSRGCKCLRHAPKHASVLRIPRFHCLSLKPDKHDLGKYVFRVVTSITHSAVLLLPRSCCEALNATLTARGMASTLASLALESMILSSAASLLYTVRNAPFIIFFSTYVIRYCHRARKGCGAWSSRSDSYSNIIETPQTALEEFTSTKKTLFILSYPRIRMKSDSDDRESGSAAQPRCMRSQSSSLKPTFSQLVGFDGRSPLRTF